MYARVTSLTNVGGRINYVKNKKNREEVVGFCNSASEEFWKMIAKENQEQFSRSTNSKRPGAKCSEGREIVIGLPNYFNDFTAAKQLQIAVKTKLGVECVVAIHQKQTVNKDGERVLNTHAHIILAERTLLDEPIVTEEKRASRTYYYNEKGKQCKKSEAVKCTLKGEITQEACVRYFSNKINFHNLKNLEPFINSLTKQFKWEKFDLRNHFPQRKIGKNNPKEKYFKEYNELVKQLNEFFDKHKNIGDGSASEPSELTPKEFFCQKYEISQRFGINKIDFVKECFADYKKTFEEKKHTLSPVEELQLRAELKDYIRIEEEIREDIKKAETVLQDFNSSDFIKNRVANIYKNDLEEKYFVVINKSFIARLKIKLEEVRKNINALIEKLKLTKNAPDMPKKLSSGADKNTDIEHSLD